MKRRIVVAYAGDPETSAWLPSLAALRGADVVALMLDLGQEQELEDVRGRALAAGAIRAHVLDVRDEFARDYVVPALHAAVREPEPALQLPVAPLVRKKLEEIATIEQAVEVIDRFGEQPNLWGRAGSYVWTRDASAAPDMAAEVEVSFEQGIPAAINGVAMSLTELIEILNIIAGHHGVGRVQMRDTFGEAPAAVVLHAAYRALNNAVSPPDEAARRRMTGSVRITLLQGRHTVVGCRPAHTAAQS